MAKVLRVRCPLCSMMPLLDNLFLDVAEVHLYLQEFGGRKKSIWIEKNGEFIKKPQGVMEYTDITDEEKEQIDQIKNRILDKIEEIKKILISEKI